MPKREDSLLVEDILQSGLKIQNYTQGYSFAHFETDERTIDAVIRNFEIIGEASRNISSDLKERHSAIPWRDMISYRNFLIHDYFGVSLHAVWNIIQDDLPVLLEQVNEVKQKIGKADQT